MRNMSVQNIVNSAIRPLKEFNGAALLTAMIISALSTVGYKYANIYTMKGQPLSLYLTTAAWFVIWALIGYIGL